MNLIDSSLFINASTIFSNNSATGGTGGAMRGCNSLIAINSKVIFSGNKAAIADSAIASNKALQGNENYIEGARKTGVGNDWEQVP